MFDEILRILINGFIGISLFWMFFWDSEPVNPIKKYWIPKIQFVYIWLGLTAEWKMFSPDPPLRNLWPRVKITLANNEVITWESTPTSDMNVIDKLRYKKFHKFYFEVAKPKAAYHTKRDFIEYLMNKYSFPDKCTKVEIYVVCQQVNPFENQSELPQPIQQQLIYTFYPDNNNL
jgi:hypothetical protein